MSTLCYDEKHFYIDGEPVKFMSGAMHYFRIVPEYWEDRLLKLKECGCNCVETYVCWNLHEKTQGEFDFSGWLDFGKFLDMARDLGLYAIVRPGPFICSEWDFGGLPWWLLKYPDMEPRCYNERYMELCKPYLKKVCEILKPRMITEGGNVIFVQIENEYGSYGNDKEYLSWLKSFYEEQGITGPFLTSDGETEMLLANGSVDGALASVNYRKDSERCIGTLKAFRKDQPGAVLELRNGRGMRWQEEFVRRDVEEVKESVVSAMEHAELVNLYMFHGGTTFGFMNGALGFGKELIVQRTSYDVDAPLDEYGRRTPKYYAEQEVICKGMGKEIVNTAKDTVLASYDIKKTGECSLKESGLSLEQHKYATIKPMEFFDQGYGYIVYETNARIGDEGGTLIFPEIHDVAHVYIDGVYVKTLYRNGEDKEVDIPQKGSYNISVLVENLGRVNYGVKLRDHKGLIGDLVLFDKQYSMYSKALCFTVYLLPLTQLPSEYSGKARENEPAFYRYEFTAEEPQDTVLHFEGFTRGVAFINGFNLGRHWALEHAENQLFIPAPFVKKGKNEIIVFDVLHRDCDKELCLCE